jgi:hypothetical protein
MEVSLKFEYITQPFSEHQRYLWHYPVLNYPELSDLLGISYHWILVLAIGNDGYNDTSLICYRLKNCFPASAGYGTIILCRQNGKADTGLTKAFASNYERAVFPLGATLLPWQKFQLDFVRDREDIHTQNTLAGCWNLKSHIVQWCTNQSSNNGCQVATFRDYIIFPSSSSYHTRLCHDTHNARFEEPSWGTVIWW